MIDAPKDARDYRCLRCGKVMCAGRVRPPIWPACPDCARERNPPIHPHWVDAGPVETFRLNRDAYDQAATDLDRFG